MYRFAIIGCGRIAERHAENIIQHGKLSAVCDIVKDKADSMGKAFGATAYYDIDDLLRHEPDIDIVVVCSPNGLHAEHAIKSLQHRKHVLCEKPLCITSNAAWHIVHTAHFCQRKIFVVKQNRYNEPVQLVKEYLDEGRLGRILSFQINCFWNRPQAYYNGDWKGSRFLDGGVLYTQFSHFIDLLYWFLGDVATAKSFIRYSGLRENLEVEDSGTAILRTEQGAIGTLNYTINSYNRNVEGSFAIFGERGSIKIGGQYLNTLEWFEVEGLPEPVLSRPAHPNQYGFYQGSMSNHDKVYEDLVKSLRGHGTLLEAKDAVKTIEIIERIYAGAEQP